MLNASSGSQGARDNGVLTDEAEDLEGGGSGVGGKAKHLLDHREGGGDGGSSGLLVNNKTKCVVARSGTTVHDINSSVGGSDGSGLGDRGGLVAGSGNAITVEGDVRGRGAHGGSGN